MKRINVCGLPHPIAEFGRCVLAYKHEGDHKTVTGQGWPPEIKAGSAYICAVAKNVLTQVISAHDEYKSAIAAIARDFHSRLPNDPINDTFDAANATNLEINSTLKEVLTLLMMSSIDSDEILSVDESSKLKSVEEVNEELRKNA